ncbi:hypothetical protein ACFL2D_00585 [Patescibacteria group bacterium]
MFETSLDMLYIAIGTSILVVAGFLSYLLYKAAKMVEESSKTVENVNKQLAKIDPVVDEVIPTIQEVNESVRGINKNIIHPISNLGNYVKKFSSIFNFLTTDVKEDK